MNNKDFEDTFEFHINALQNITNFAEDSDFPSLDSESDPATSGSNVRSLSSTEKVANDELFLRSGVYSI